jgi:hypothetical protein
VGVAGAIIVGVAEGVKVDLRMTVPVGEGGGRNVQVGAMNSVGVGVDWMLEFTLTHPSRMRAATIKI